MTKEHAVEVSVMSLILSIIAAIIVPDPGFIWAWMGMSIVCIAASLLYIEETKEDD